MPLQLFLNALSCPTGAVQRDRAVSFLIGLVNTVRAAKLIDEQLILNSEEPINNFALGDNHTIASLRNSGEFAEEAQYLKALNNRAPFSQILGEAPGVDPNGFEYKLRQGAGIWSGKNAQALGLAHRLTGLAISIPSDAIWQPRVIELDLIEISDDGTLRGCVVEVRNAAQPSDIVFHEATLRADCLPAQRSGADIWQNRAALFPFLEFIPRTQSQIEDLLVGDPMLVQLWIKLSGFNSAAAVWAAGNVSYPLFPFGVRPESRSRKALTKFLSSDGTELTFSDHTDLAPTEARIHYLVQSAPRRHILIGHVGRKLGIG